MNLRKRYEDAPWLHPCDVVLVGLGAVGVGTGLSLLANNYDLHVFDYDTVSEENVIPQGYLKSHIGWDKTEAFNDLADNFINKIAFTYNLKYNGLCGEVMISAVDNMSGRKDIFETFLSDDTSKIFIDARMIPCQFEVYCVQKSIPETIDKYRETLFEDSAIYSENCSFKSSRATNLSIHGYISSLVSNYVVNREENSNYLSCPFKYFYNSNFLELCQSIYL